MANKFTALNKISREELEIPPEKWTEEDYLSIYYCDLADSQLI
jgi:hypothetical protein